MLFRSNFKNLFRWGVSGGERKDFSLFFFLRLLINNNYNKFFLHISFFRNKDSASTDFVHNGANMDNQDWAYKLNRG